MRYIILLLPLFLFAMSSPYQTLSIDEKLTIFTQYFMDKTLKSKVPPPPKKEKLKDDGASLKPIKYEKYFNYIQRIKNIKESRKKEQKKLDEEYLGKIGFYNGKLKTLKKFYHQKKNITPILEDSLNKAFTVVYGKPILKDIKYDSFTNKLTATLDVDDLYQIESFVPQKLEIFIYKDFVADFVENFDLATVLVNFDFEKDYIKYKDVDIVYKSATYKGCFLSKPTDKFHIKVKVNDKIFEPIDPKKESK